MSAAKDLHPTLPNPWVLRRTKQPLTDYILLGGLLLERYGDGTRRRLITFYEQTPYVVITTAHSQLEIPTTAEAVAKLHELHALQSAPDWSHAEHTRFKLSLQGKRLVTTEWFKEEVTLHDLIVAGASLNLATGDLSWKEEY